MSGMRIFTGIFCEKCGKLLKHRTKWGRRFFKKPPSPFRFAVSLFVFLYVDNVDKRDYNGLVLLKINIGPCGFWNL